MGNGRVGQGGGEGGGGGGEGRGEPSRYAGRECSPGRRAGLALRVYIQHTCMRRLVYSRRSSREKRGGVTVFRPRYIYIERVTIGKSEPGTR